MKLLQCLVLTFSELGTSGFWLKQWFCHEMQLGLGCVTKLGSKTRRFQESCSKVEVFAFCQFFPKPQHLWQGKYLPTIGLQAASGKNSFPRNKEGEHSPPAALGIFSCCSFDLYTSPGFQSQKVTTWNGRSIPNAQESPGYGRRLAVLA